MRPATKTFSQRLLLIRCALVRGISRLQVPVIRHFPRWALKLNHIVMPLVVRGDLGLAYARPGTPSSKDWFAGVTPNFGIDENHPWVARILEILRKKETVGITTGEIQEFHLLNDGLNETYWRADSMQGVMVCARTNNEADNKILDEWMEEYKGRITPEALEEYRRRVFRAATEKK